MLEQGLLEHDDAEGSVVFAKLWRWPLYCVSTGLLTVLATFTIFFGLHMNRDVPVTSGSFIIPTISRTGGTNPTAPIFTLGLHLGSFQAAVSFLAVYSRGQQLLAASPQTQQSRQIRKWNLRVLISGLLSAAGMALTGTFYLSLNPRVHSVCASVLFLFGMLYCVLHVCMLARPFAELGASTGTKEGSSTASEDKWLRFKAGVCAFGAVACVMYTLVLAQIQGAEGCDHDNWCAVRNWRSVMEYILATALFLYLGGLTHDLQGCTLRLHFL